MRAPASWEKAKVTAALVILTALAWALVSATRSTDAISIWGGFIPARLGMVGDSSMAPFWLTPLTSAFIHASFLHLALNMVILVFCGRPTEAVLGPVAFLILYLVGALAAAGAQFAANPLSIAPMVGASGAISAVLGAYALLFGRNRVRVSSIRLARWLNALWLLAAWVALQLAIGFVFSEEPLQIAFAAHIGGFVAGLALANPLLLLRYRGA